MKEAMQFSSKEAFRAWLQKNCHSCEGVWLLFGKSDGPVTLTAHEALEEALCFGWIDGKMQRINNSCYRKYFAQRRPNSKWSEKNKTLVDQLQQQGRMTDHGKAKIKEAKSNGQWNAPSQTVTDDQIEALSRLLEGHEPAYTNFQSMPPSVRKTYARAYWDAKTDAGREKRFSWMLERLNQNLKPM